MYNSLEHRPRTSDRFEQLMDLYERNYMLIRLLVPELRSLSGGCFVSECEVGSEVGGEADVGGNSPALELRDICHSKYTSTFKLTYHFKQELSGVKPYEPDLFIRLYHDARSCEVMSGLLPEGRFEPRRTRDLAEGQRLNLFLHRWLGYCLRQGHRFSGAPVSEQMLEAYCTQC